MLGWLKRQHAERTYVGTLATELLIFALLGALNARVFPNDRLPWIAIAAVVANAIHGHVRLYLHSRAFLAEFERQSRSRR